MTDTNFEIRRMRRQDLDHVVEWAAGEGWNPGIHDAECFSVTDPDGLLIGFLNGRPVASLSAVAYDECFGFIGLYIVAAGHRGRGYGLRVWKAGLDHLGERILGLDSVVAQQENYRRSGFVVAHTNARYGGLVEVERPTDSTLIPLADMPFHALSEFDREIFRAPREMFLRCWRVPEKRPCYAVMRDGEVAGYGVIRACRKGHKVGPLFANDEGAADVLFRALAANAQGKEPVFIDVPMPNAAAVSLARRYGLQPVFETVRMYRGMDPEVPLARVYGITTLEQG